MLFFFCFSIERWDRYLANSTKGLTRGSGSRTKVSPQINFPKKWGDFLRDSRNKTELFAFLTEKVTSEIIPESKIIFITLGMCLRRILHIGSYQNLTKKEAWFDSHRRKTFQAPSRC